MRPTAERLMFLRTVELKPKQVDELWAEIDALQWDMEKTVRDWLDDRNELRARVRELEEPLRWLVNLCHDVGKAGESPEPGEWEDAIEQGKAALATTPRDP